MQKETVQGNNAIWRISDQNDTVPHNSEQVSGCAQPIHPAEYEEKWEISSFPCSEYFHDHL